ncbi:MAG: sugar phosphate nucleotidyltransferase [Candidatus Verstraetearchaeota archaeon]|nr:sugar phosphate nucleotidyltransferase [Candidatus Verstraetearchaeota archaeon]
MILAAGRGTRLDPLDGRRPKHVLPVGGAPLIHHALRAMKNAGLEEVFIVVHHMKEMVISSVGDGSSFSLRVHYLDQGGLGGTGDALRAAAPLLGEDGVLLVYGDLAFKPSFLRELVSEFESNGGAVGGIIGAALLGDTSEYGTLEMKDGKVLRIVEKSGAHVPGLVNAGIYALSPEILGYLDRTPRSERGEFELTTTINIASSEGMKFSAMEMPEGSWVDVGRPWNVLEANRLLFDELIRGRSIRGTVEENVQIRGNVIVEEGAKILSGSYIEGPVWISSGCIVGPNCYLRPYTYLCEGVRVGNACEVKGSIVMERSHIGHLSYVGDSVIGADCNLGAGTITANLRFDDRSIRVSVKGCRVDTGRRKVGAFLGDGVKTGINVSIYPGVKIGHSSWIAPHTPVSKDIPPETVVSPALGVEMRPRR